ncbi:MAG: hypothetical protein AAF664_06315 [Planctomycetota bacterium]
MDHFTRSSRVWMGAVHAAEIPSMYGRLHEPSPEDAELSQLMMEYRIHLAKTEYLISDRQQSCQVFTSGADNHQSMAVGIKSAGGLLGESCDLMDEIKSKLATR